MINKTWWDKDRERRKNWLWGKTDYDVIELWGDYEIDYDYEEKRVMMWLKKHDETWI